MIFLNYPSPQFPCNDQGQPTYPQGYPPGYPPQSNQPLSGYIQPYGNNLVADSQPMISGIYQIPLDSSQHYTFSEVTTKHLFIRKIFAILSLQLLLIFILSALFSYQNHLNRVFYNHPEIWWFTLTLFTLIFIALTIGDNFRRGFPNNSICLVIFTLSLGFMLAVASATFHTEVIIETVGNTALVCLGLVIFSYQKRLGYSVSIGTVVTVLIILTLFTATLLFLKFLIIYTVLSTFSALIWSLYIVFGVDTLVRFGYKYNIQPNEFVFGALNVYMDIFSNIFDIVCCRRRRQIVG